MGYPKYTWVGNKLSKEQMSDLYKLKQKDKKPITQHVKEAVSLYLKQKGVSNEN